MNNENTFGDSLDSAVQSSDLPTSGGSFEKTPAQQSLGEMESVGKDVINAQEVHSNALQELNAIEGVSSEVSTAAQEALKATLGSLEKQSKLAETMGNFWGFVRGSFIAKDPSVGKRQQAETQLTSAVGYVRETGAEGRAMSQEDEQNHRTRREGYKRSLEQASGERPLSLREKIFNYANEKVLRNMAKHERLNTSIEIIREQIPSVVGRVSEDLSSKDSQVEQRVTTTQDDLRSSQEAFQGTLSAAQDANYRGYSGAATSEV
jgi:hypothetical protein